MSTDGISTWRYLQNIADFFLRPEAHMNYDDGETAKNYRPNGINFKIILFEFIYKISIIFIFCNWEIRYSLYD